MTTAQVESIALELFKKHGLDVLGWTFGFDSAKRRLGQTNHSLMRITVSKFYAENNPVPMVINTLLHEIAHALVGTTHGHDDTWRQKAISIGCNGNRCSSQTISHPAKYTLSCTCCGASWTAHRLFMQKVQNGWHSSCGRKSQGMIQVSLNKGA